MHLYSLTTNKIKIFALMMFFLLSFRVTQFFPGFAQVKELWIVAFFLFMILIYAPQKMMLRQTITKYELYIVFLLFFIPCMSAYAANKEFSQPLLYGILSQRNLVLAAGSLIFLFLFKRRFFTIIEVEKSLVFLAWGCLIFFSGFNAVFDPKSMMNATKGIVGGGNVEEAKFKFNAVFIVFGFFYYGLSGFRLRSTRDYLLSSLFLFYLVFQQGGRSLLLALLGGYVVFVIAKSSSRRLLALLPKAVWLATLLLLVFLLVDHAYMTKLLGKFGDALTVVLTGEKTADISANARILETQIAWPYIAKNWLIGNGDLSNQWKGGYDGVFGWFYPSDIGVVGVLYQYGLLGLMLFALQFKYAWTFSRRLANADDEHRRLVDACQGFLLYYGLHSLTTGAFANSSEVGLLFIAVLACASLTRSVTFTPPLTMRSG